MAANNARVQLNRDDYVGGVGKPARSRPSAVSDSKKSSPTKQTTPISTSQRVCSTHMFCTVLERESAADVLLQVF